MPKDVKTLCDWSKRDLREKFDELEEIVAHSRFVCMKCGRSAESKKYLCKAKALKIVAGANSSVFDD